LLQILTAVAIEGRQLVFGKRCPEPMAKLAARCMDVDPEARPTFPDIIQTLAEMPKEKLPAPAA
jgi:hypothetical protein